MQKLWKGKAGKKCVFGVVPGVWDDRKSCLIPLTTQKQRRLDSCFTTTTKNRRRSSAFQFILNMTLCRY
jgi:hypothetical protein